MMSAKMCRVSNLERRPVVIRGRSGANYHLASLEKGREIRAVELEGNATVDKLKQRHVLSVEEAPLIPTNKRGARSKSSEAANAPKKGGESGGEGS
jgi:hypothetical protein